MLHLAISRDTRGFRVQSESRHALKPRADIQAPTGAEHQGIAAHIFFEQQRAESPFLGNEHVARLAGKRKACPRQETGFPDLCADNKPQTRRSCRVRRLAV